MVLLDWILSVVPYVGGIVVGIAILYVLRRGKNRKRKHVLASDHRQHVRTGTVFYGRTDLPTDRLPLKKVERCSSIVMGS